ELLAVARAETLDRGIVEQDLAHRLQRDAVDRAGRALRQRIEAAQAFERVAEEIEAQRRRGARREQVEDAAAHRELARLAHGIGPAIAIAAEESRQPVERDAPAAPELEHAIAEQRPGR